jgi:hypothetical protein
MIINDHTQDQVRINHLGVIMSLLDNKNNYFSYGSHGLIVDDMDYERGISKCHREFRFDEKGLLYASIVYEEGDLEGYNKLLQANFYDKESEDNEE